MSILNIKKGGITMDVASIVLAFLAGIAGTAMGGIQSFVAVGLLGMAGMGVAAAIPALGVGPVIGNMAFGIWFNPALSFFASVTAYAYACKMGYIKTGKDIGLPLASINKPDALLVGGVAGAIGYVTMTLLTGPDYLGIKADGAATAIAVLSIIVKLAFEKTIVGKVPDEVKKNGGRFSTKNGAPWLAWQRNGFMKFLLGIAWGPLSGAATFILFANPATAAFAPFVGFFICAFMFTWLAVGQPGSVVHHPAILAAYGVQMLVVANGGVVEGIALTDVLIWSAGIGVFAMFLADFVADIVHVYGTTHVDPPAITIFIVSFIIMTVLPAVGLTSGLILPLALLALCFVIAIIQDKSRAVEAGITQSDS